MRDREEAPTRRSRHRRGSPAAGSVAIWSAIRVLPIPPGPVRTRRRTCARRSSEQAVAISCWRPINGVSGAGRARTLSSSGWAWDVTVGASEDG